MPNVVDILNEKDVAETKRFTKEDYERGLQALQRLQELRKGLPEVDAVAIIREMRDSGGRCWAEDGDDE